MNAQKIKMQRENEVKIVITAGELSGVSAMIILKAFEHEEVQKINPTIYGDKALLLELQEKLIQEGKLSEQSLNIVDDLHAQFCISQLGKPSKETGYAAGFYFQQAIEDAKNKKIDGIVTAPLDKDNLQKGGFPYTGHTTMIQDLTETKDVVMMLYGDYLKVALLTIHKPIKDVASFIDKESIKKVAKVVAKEFKQKFQIEAPRIALLGLNPHAGENGKLGKEEQEEYLPAIKELRESGIHIDGPFPADTYFYSTYKNYDVTLASYHDQGLIPLKMLHFDDGVNISLGLPILRTSVDHGTAYDIANRFELASEKSLIAAIKEAYRMALYEKSREQNKKIHKNRDDSPFETVGNQKVLTTSVI